jgi:hypothetical protein
MKRLNSYYSSSDAKHLSETVVDPIVSCANKRR